MYYWIYDYPIWTTYFLFIAAFVGFSFLGTIFVRPILRLFFRRQPDINTLIGSILSFFGVIFGILIGMLAVVTYQNNSQAVNVVTSEAASLASLYRDISSYPEPERGRLQRQLKDYTSYVIDTAWPLQRLGQIPTGGNSRVSAIADALTTFEPRTKGQELLHAVALQSFNDFVTFRRMRLQSVLSGIPGIMWFTVLAGCVMSLMLIWLFEMRFFVQIILGGLLSFALATVISLIALMDNPFRGSLGVSSDAYELVLNQVMEVSTTQ